MSILTTLFDLAKKKALEEKQKLVTNPYSTLFSLTGQKATAGMVKTIEDTGIGQKIGQKLQQFPDTTIRLPEPQASNNLLTEVTNTRTRIGNRLGEFVTSLPGDVIRSYGRTLERISTPKGRGEIAKGVGQIATTKPELSTSYARKTLENPATQTAFDLSDFLPGGMFAALGVKALEKKGAKEFLLEAGKKEAAKAIEKTAPERLAHLITYEDSLRKIGFTKKEAAQIGFKDAETIIDKGLTPEAYFKSIGEKPDAYKRSADFMDEMAKERKATFQDYTRQTEVRPPSQSSYVVEKLHDLGNTSMGFRDVYRNFEHVFGDQYKTVKQTLLDPFDRGKGLFVDFQKTWANKLDEKIVTGLGIKKGSKESELVQALGEGKVNLIDVVNQVGEAKAKKIGQADAWFRQAYDTLLDQVNQVRKGIYPNSPEMWVAKRKDYYRHFRELSGFEGIKNIFENPAGIDPKLVGVSDFTTPRSRWLPFAQHRTGDSTKLDAVGGFLEYLPKASYAIHIDPHIEKFRGLGKELADATSDAGNPDTYKRLNNFVEFLEDYSNDLTGKTNPLDRGIQKYIPGGRKTFKALDWVNKRVKANTVLGNVSSSLAQLGNLPAGTASAGVKNTIAGALDTVLSPLKQTEIVKSDFIKERYFKDLDKFDTGILNNSKKFAVWMTSVLDEFGTKTIWNAHYKKAVTQNIESPVKYADDMTRKLVAGRGIGEVPIVQKSKAFQLFAPFQLEVQNMWWVMKDFVDEKSFGKVAKLLVYNYLFNTAIEKATGNRILFDPIDALIDSFSEPDTSPVQKAGRLGGEVLSNVALGQSIASVYPERGFKVGETQAPTRKELFGRNDPTRFGSGVLAAKGLQDPLYKILPGYGGNQLKKTIEGVQAYKEGYSATNAGNVQYEIPQNTESLVRSILFGKTSLPQAQEYFNSKNISESDKIYQEYKRLKSSKPDEALKLLIATKSKSPAIMGEVKQKMRDDILKVTAEEQKIRNLPVADKSRAYAVNKKLKGLSKEDQDKLISDYLAKKVITKEVYLQLLEMRKTNV